MTKCVRCGLEAHGSIMSMFNHDVICLDCKRLETKHPDYPRARAFEEMHARAGDLNYLGIGLPDGYREWADRHALRGIVVSPATAGGAWC